MNLDHIATAAAVNARVFPGLPVVSSHQTARRRVIGSTVTDLDAAIGEDVDVGNMPSVKLQSVNDGQVEVRMQLNTRYASSLFGQWPAMDAAVADIVRQAKQMSAGPYTLKTLRALGHPYGRGAAGPRKTPRGLRYVKGRTGSVPNLTQVNVQSGELQRSWRGKVSATPSGVTMTVSNLARHAAYVALGTRKMQAHFPLPYLLVANRSMLMGAWQKDVRAARQRYLSRRAVMDATAQILGSVV